MEFFPIQILFLVVLMNRYVLGPLLRRIRGARFDVTLPLEPSEPHEQQPAP